MPVVHYVKVHRPPLFSGCFESVNWAVNQSINWSDNRSEKWSDNAPFQRVKTPWYEGDLEPP